MKILLKFVVAASLVLGGYGFYSLLKKSNEVRSDLQNSIAPVSISPRPENLVVSHGKTPGSQSPKDSAAISLESFLNSKFPGDWTIQRAEDGKVVSFMGGVIPGAGKNSDKAYQLVKELAPMFDIDPAQIREAPVRQNSTSLALSYSFDQYYEGFEVLNGGITVLARKEDGAVYIVNNNLKRVSAVNTRPALNAGEAEKLVETKYAHRSPTVKLKEDRLVVWADQPFQELAWIFIVEVKSPSFDKYQVVLGADSKTILSERTVLMH